MKITDFEVDNHLPFFLMAGPCVVENETTALETAFYLKDLTQKLGVNFIYKSSFAKANRSSISSFSGLPFKSALAILRKVKEEVKVPIVTDVHEDTPLEEVAEIVDVLQTPAFLCRQTNFVRKVSALNKPVNIKKGQFLSPWEMQHVVEKAVNTGNNKIMVCERGFSFGYNNLVVDMRSLEIMKNTGCPVIFDGGHSVQLPGGLGSASGGMREFIPVLARAAIAVGIAGLFLETHPTPDKALCDGPNMWPLYKMEELLIQLKKIDKVIKNY